MATHHDGFGHEKSHKGDTNNWITPKYILDSLGGFDLDPCACIPQPWETAKQCYTVNDDGLKQDWTGRVFLNPPYGTEAGEWMAKLANHNNGIALIFARTETKMYFESIWEYADSILFLKGRIKFFLPNGTLTRDNGKPVTSAGAPSVLIAYGKNNTEVLRNCGLKGKLVPLKT